jgi:hypothetical protein
MTRHATPGTVSAVIERAIPARSLPTEILRPVFLHIMGSP